MTARIRPMLVAALASGLLLGPAACSDDSGDSVAEPAAPAVTAASTGATTAATEQPSAAATAEETASSDGVTVTLELVNGKPSERPEANVDVAEGERFTLVVSSDAAQEIHVHGYDKYLNIAAGTTARLSFIADKAGSWLVENHETGAELFNLRVR